MVKCKTEIMLHKDGLSVMANKLYYIEHFNLLNLHYNDVYVGSIELEILKFKYNSYDKEQNIKHYNLVKR